MMLIVEMEEVREIAEAHYRAGSPRVQALAMEFYRAMDSDGDGRVDLSEFLAFMAHRGYPYMQNPNFFGELDRDGSGTLDFWEVMTLYYIIKSGRPFCNSCTKFIPGVFFSCVECFKINPKTSFYLCRDCHRHQRFDNHDHDGRTQFLDNYTLLQAVVDPPSAHSSPPPNLTQNIPTNAIVPQLYNLVHPHSALVPAASPDQNWVRNRSTNDMVPRELYGHNSYPAYNMAYYYPHNNANYAMYSHNSYPVYNMAYTHNIANYETAPSSPNHNWRKWEVALFAFETALSIGAIASTACSIL